MSQYDIYVLFLCLIVFVLLAGLSAVLLTYIVKLTLRLIRHGAEDEKIITEYEKALKKKRKSGIIDTIVTVVLCVFLLGFFGFSTYINCQKNEYSATSPTIKVVQSGSMSKKHEKNTYLYENNINDQIQTFDLILVYKIPDEFALELYDVVLYEVDDMLVLHRIVGIEEPNEKHPEHRHFLLQGDNVENPDRFPVLYSQMQAIYRGQRIPFLGSFVNFMQSPAGWLCIFLIVVSMIATPIIEKIIEKEKRKRLVLLGIITEETETAQEQILEQGLVPTEETQDTQPHPFAGFGARDMRSFAEKLADADEDLKAEYAEIEEHLRHIEDLTVRDSRKYRTFRRGRVAVSRFTIRGKTLNASLGLEPAEYAESKYVFTDETHVKSAKSFPMRVKVTSARQVRWTKELITDIVEKYGLGWREFAAEDIPAEEVALDEEISVPVTVTEEVAVSRFAGFGARDMRSFAEKLADAKEEVKARYAELERSLKRLKKVRVIEGRTGRTFKCGNVPVARFAIRGKTLNVYLGLRPAEFTETKYIYTDVSDSKKYARYPMRVKITSARQTRWVQELIAKLSETNGLTVLEGEHEE